jgi:tRNA pseudouridine55 synthase
MDGILLVDKPVGPTSHDAVARLRRTTGERRIGHTGTLDPRASGLLVLVLGQATRLATFLSGCDKTYDAVIHLGITTETDDAEGAPRGTWAGPLPGGAEIDAALAAFRGTFAQQPPRHSAKKIAGQRAYDLARRDQVVELKAVPVTVRTLDRTSLAGARLGLHLTATSGFYVRSLARDLGERLGCGAHLAGLRRTRVGPFTIDRALGLDEAERAGRDLASRVIPPADALPDWPRVAATEAGLARVRHGNPIGPEHVVGPWPAAGPGGATAKARVVGPDGRLVAVADLRGGALHPAVVLGYHR